MIEALRKVHRLARRAASVAAGIPAIAAMLRDPARGATYYPGEERKSRTRIFFENVAWLLRHHEVNEFYFLFGFDRKRGADPDAYLPYSVFKEIRNRHNTSKWIGRYNADYTCILKDKFVFWNLLESLGFPTPRILALGSGAEVIELGSGTRTPIAAIASLEIPDAFCKTLLGECGEGAFPFRIAGGKIFVSDRETPLDEFQSAVGEGFIIEERAAQHRRMAELYPHSLNTIRLVTVNDGRRVYPFSAVLRTGARGATVDNWARGGLVGGIDLETGRLAKEFRFKPGYGGRLERHPDTGVAFGEFEVPFFREAADAACRLHGFLYGIHSIGWDIAIGEGGPIFIEGNDNWEITLNQAAEGGLRERFLASLPKPEHGA